MRVNFTLICPDCGVMLKVETYSRIDMPIEMARFFSVDRNQTEITCEDCGAVMKPLQLADLD
jgi:hypothetical protein